MNRVAVTGMGMLCSLGNNVAECWSKLASGRSGIAPLAEPGAPPYKFQYGAQAGGFRPSDHFSEKELMLLERFAQMAVVSAREAIAQSGLSFGSNGNGSLRERTAIVTGTSVGGQFAEEIGYYRLYKDNNPRVAPLTIPRTMSNAGASAISVEYRITGPVYTVSTACASSNHAIGQAFWMVRNGQVLAAIAGGSEAVFAEGLLRAWEAMRVVSSQPCRPFSADRNGLTLGEGAAMLVLENWDHARARNAKIHGEILGFGMSSDAHHITQPCVDGPARTMRWALGDAGLTGDRIDYINAHGTGTVANDVTETQAIRSVFAQHADHILVSSTKSMHGHTLGAAGAIEAIATILALEHGIAPPTINFTRPDPACNLNLVTDRPGHAPLEIALSNTFAFGGLNATLIMKRYSN